MSDDRFKRLIGSSKKNGMIRSFFRALDERLEHSISMYFGDLFLETSLSSDRQDF
jgi:hypothetical protein